ncbi:MAG: hypothetical protein FWH48_00710 [Oscillospiraceae bacterium]|nr:hypothetical protein [Oscillospiraceae bacterium]
MYSNIEIDVFTPCLTEAKTGAVVETEYMLANANELKKLKKQGWNFNWDSKDLASCEIYKLTVAGDIKIQGLIALEDFARDKAIYVKIAENAPDNIGESRQYKGVGGHLFAIAVKISIIKGYGGFLFMDAKNTKLVEHYEKSLGATFLGQIHPYRMYISEKAAQKILSSYTLKEGK